MSGRITTTRGRILAATVALASVMGMMFSACGETTEADPTPVTTWKITPADGAPPTAEPTPSEATPAPTPPGGGAATTLTIIGVSSTFDVEELTAPAGPMLVVFDNQDAGIVHNIHFFEGDDNDGETVGETELEVGLIEQTLEMQLQPGEYFYQCDAHPTTMTGTLTVS